MVHTPTRAPALVAPETQAGWTALMLTPALVALAWLAMAQGWFGPDAGLLTLVGCTAWLTTAVQGLPACTEHAEHTPHTEHKASAANQHRAGAPDTRR